MEKPLQLLVAGGDLRQLSAAAALAAHPHLNVAAVGFSHAETTVKRLPEGEPWPESEVLLLPVPASDDGVLVRCPYGTVPLSLESLLDRVKNGGLVCGGRLSASVCRMCQERNLDFCDYFRREELCLANAVPTAEGAIQIAMEQLPRTICGSRVLIVGYGRIGRILAARLQGLQAKVTVAARSCTACAACDANGLKWMHPREIAAAAGQFDWICNTVPASILQQAELEAMRQDVLVIDLASKPGGTDFEAAKRLNRHVIWALALPGKVAPVTAGEMIAKTIFNILEERGLAHGTNQQ